MTRGATTWMSGRCSRGASTARSPRRSSRQAHIDAAARADSLRSSAARARGASIWSFTYESMFTGSVRRATPPRNQGHGCARARALERAGGRIRRRALSRRYSDYVDGPRSPTSSLTQHGPARPRLSGARCSPPAAPSRRSGSRTLATASRTPTWRACLVAHSVVGAALLAILARERIFSIRGGRLLLGCTSGCDLVTPATKYAWPRLPPWRRHARGARACARGPARGARRSACPLMPRSSSRAPHGALVATDHMHPWNAHTPSVHACQCQSWRHTLT